MRITTIAVAAFAAILANSVLIPGSQAQNAPYAAPAGSMPVPNAPVSGAAYQQTKSYVPEPGLNSADATPAVGGYDPNEPPPPYQQQQPDPSGQTYVAASGYASERLDGADGFSPEEIKSAGHRFFGKVSSGFASAGHREANASTASVDRKRYQTVEGLPGR